MGLFRKLDMCALQLRDMEDGARLRLPVATGQTGLPNDPPVLPEPCLMGQPKGQGDTMEQSHSREAQWWPGIP